MHNDYSWIYQILQPENITSAWIETAVKAILAERQECIAFNIDSRNAREQFETRANLFRQVYPEIVDFIRTNLKVSVGEMLPTVWKYWIPLALNIAQTRRDFDRPLVQGILGGQGTGKTTLAKALNLILPKLGYISASLSIDDLYLTYQERCQLFQEDERLIWRGPPGTHDIKLGLETIAQFRLGKKPLSLPRFDKSRHNGMGDRATPEIFPSVDILLFEGWLIGVRPIDPQDFDNPPPPIKTNADRIFAKDMNRALATYLPLWAEIDRLLVLFPQDYRFSLQWRKQAEQEMIAKGKTGMTDHQVEEFVNYFWRALHPQLFIQPLVESCQYTDLAIEIAANHQFCAIYRPNRE